MWNHGDVPLDLQHDIDVLVVHGSGTALAVCLQFLTTLVG